ncbi:MAG: Gfo/Idh/MocA family oxidoreductase [Saprospiraceae bacterium]|nr:Gfo/Idh/MocA family oxidoreductase [Saprospiraceae bacterium]
MADRLKIGVLGTGHLGKIHLKCLEQLPDRYELMGFCDPDDEQAKAVSESFGLKRFASLADMLQAVDVVDIVTPTITHYDMGREVLLGGKHLFIEKPVTQTVSEAAELLRLSREKNLKVQVGHVERFNPALLSVDDLNLNPMFIEAHRLAMFNPRGTDVSVVLDLMIHDLDIILNLINSPVKDLHASGVAILSETADICNARIAFENGAVVNLTASRMSLKQMRKVRLFQKDAYISLDFLEKNAQVVRLFESPDDVPAHGNLMELPTPKGTKYIHVDLPEIEPINAIKMELETFADAIQFQVPVKVSLEDGYRALELAHQINDLVVAQFEANNE